ncbi:hypothetical protein AAZV13_04G088900 [Glycine max]
MKRWSIKLNDVVDMMNTSGFGWDDTRKCVISDNSQVLYENILKLATMLIKEFEKLQGIFGKDRANGRGAERCEDAMENQIGENQVSDDDEWLHQHDNSPSFIGNTFPLDLLKVSIVNGYDPSKSNPSKRDLVEEVKKLGLTKEEEINLVIKFAHNQQYEKFFWEFEGSQRMSFVRKVMRI